MSWDADFDRQQGVLQMNGSGFVTHFPKSGHKVLAITHQIWGELCKSGIHRLPQTPAGIFDTRFFEQDILPENLWKPNKNFGNN